MKAIFTRRTIIIFSTALLLAIISIVSINVMSSSGPVTGFANVVTRPVRELASTVARAFGSIFSAIYDYEAQVARNDELQRRVAELEANYREAHDLAEENAMLRALHDFRERYSGYESEMASLSSWNSDNWSSTFVINKGSSNSNIRRGMGVATEYGALIGQVFEVGATESTVITVLDTKFSAASFVGRRDSGGEEDSYVTVKGDYTYLRTGLLILDTINEDLIVRSGDSVVTSGYGGVFPPGLTVGTVEEVFRHAGGIGRFATVRPNLEFERLTTVFVITEFENPT
ncbi:MAG: rod shape-determining protein MreC [Oscillospiraceae bacterium]|nr:rod shape-determining protein MreC [Oscillospiraceae bacterium]